MRKYVYIFLLLLTPTISSAGSFVISEALLNPEGSDSGREWVEVTNIGSQVSVTGYKFKEGATSTTAVNHSMKIPDGENFGWLIGVGEKFVIADNPEKFKLDYPDYLGKYFDSSFSLTNTGEYLAFTDSSKNILFEVSLTSEMVGAEGTSVCLVESVWKICNPTPGLDNLEADTSVVEAEESEDVKADDDQPVQEKTYIEIKNPDYKQKVIKADGGGDRVIMAGSSFLFEAKSYGLMGEPIKNPSYRWNFGDGGTDRGPKTLHVYHHPGDYVGTLNVKSEKYSHTDRFKIKVIEPDLVISEVSQEENYIKIKNKTKHELDISYFYLKTLESEFKIPINTFISSGAEIIFPGQYTGIEISSDSKIRLQTPNEKNIDFLHMSAQDEPLEKAQESSVQKPQIVVATQTKPKPKILPARKVEKAKPEPAPVPAAEVLEKETISQEASVIGSTGNTETKGSSFYEVMLFVLLLGVAGAVFFIKKEEPKEPDEVEKIASEIKIIEK